MAVRASWPALPRRCRRYDLDVVVTEQFADAHLLGVIVLDDQQAFTPRPRIFLDPRDRRLHAFGRRRLGHERERAARQRVLAILVERDDLHRNVPGQRILLELAQHGPAEHVGQEHVERHGSRLELLGEFKRIDAAHRDQHLEAAVAREIHDDAGVVRVVLDDQQDAVAGNDVQPVVRDCSIAPLRHALVIFSTSRRRSGATRIALVGPMYLSGR